MKHLKRFFENTDMSQNDIFSDHLQTIRDCFLEFEDINIIKSYNFGFKFKDKISTIDYNEQCVITFSKNINNRTIDEVIDTWVKHYNSLLYKEVDKAPYISIDIKLPAKSRVIKSKDINLFETILEANNRLTDDGYTIELDMNGSHNDYKPCYFIVNFTL